MLPVVSNDFFSFLLAFILSLLKKKSKTKFYCYFKPVIYA